VERVRGKARVNRHDVEAGFVHRTVSLSWSHSAASTAIIHQLPGFGVVPGFHGPADIIHGDDSLGDGYKDEDVKQGPKRGETGTGLENGGSAAGELWATIGTSALMLAQGGE
jgi:hypothetical protein